MRMLRTLPFFPPNRGKNHIWKYFPDLACGAIFWMIIHKQQFLHSDWLKTCQLIPNQWNFTSATLNHDPIVFLFITTSKIKKEIFAKICWQLKLKVHALHYANELLVRVRLSFQKLLQNRSTCRNNTKKNVWEKSNDAYSLSIRVQTTIKHISIFTLLCFLRGQKNVFFQSAS